MFQFFLLLAMQWTARFAQAKYQTMDLSDEVVLITGATAGIGEATAHRFAEEGSKVILTGRRENRLEKVKRDILEKVPSASVFSIRLDVQDIKQIESLKQNLPEDFRQVTILVNNAGLALGRNHIENTPMSDVQRMIQTNVIGLMAMTKVFVEDMRARDHGHIINIASISSHYTYPGGTVYCASKFAVQGFTESLRQELVSSGVRVTQVSPAAVNTEFSLVRLGQKEKADKVYEGWTPLFADDIADNILYVATRPKHVAIGEMIVWSTNQSPGFAGGIAKKTDKKNEL